MGREACGLVVQSESPQFEVDLAELIKTHFAHMLDQFDEQRNAQEVEPDD